MTRKWKKIKENIEETAQKTDNYKKIGNKLMFKPKTKILMTELTQADNYYKSNNYNHNEEKK